MVRDSVDRSKCSISPISLGIGSLILDTATKTLNCVIRNPSGLSRSS